MSEADNLLTRLKQLEALQERTERQARESLRISLRRLERLQEMGISDPIFEDEYDRDEYTDEPIERDAESFGAEYCERCGILRRMFV